MPTWDFQVKKGGRGAKGVQGGRTFTRIYQLTSDVRASEAEAYEYVTVTEGLDIGAAHPDAAGAGTVIVDIDVQDEADDGLQWVVTIEWGVPRSGSLSPNPLTRAPVIDWQQESETERFMKDYSLTPKDVRNSAGETFDPLPERDKARVSLTYQRNEEPDFFKRTVLPLMAYEFVVNDDWFEIDGVEIPPLFARLEIRRAPKVTEGAIEYYAVEYFLKFKGGMSGYEDDGWRERYLDRGHYEIPPASPNSWRPIRDEDGQIVQEPWPLDGAGAAKPNPDDPPAVLAPFIAYPEVDFSVLGFS